LKFHCHVWRLSSCSFTSVPLIVLKFFFLSLSHVPNHFSHHNHLLPCSPSLLFIFTNFSSSSRTEHVPNYCSNSKYSKLSFQRVLIRPKRIPDKRVMLFLLRRRNLSRADFSMRSAQCLCHNSLHGSSNFMILDALERELDDASACSLFLHCTSLNMCLKLMKTAAFFLRLGGVYDFGFNSLITNYWECFHHACKTIQARTLPLR